LEVDLKDGNQQGKAAKLAKTPEAYKACYVVSGSSKGNLQFHKCFEQQVCFFMN
jgi:hypothetical protein